MKYNAAKAFPYTVPVLFLFPLFKENLLTLMVTLLMINVVVFLCQEKKVVLPKKEVLLLTIPFWIVLFVSIFRFESYNIVKPINSVLFFLLLPLVFNYIPLSNFSTNKITFYFKILKNACFLIILYYLISFFYNYTIYDFFIVSNRVSKFRNFVYNEITFFKIHPAYFTTILMFCSAFCLRELLHNKKWIEIIYLFFFTLITFLLTTKINVLFLVVLFFVFVVFYIKGYYLQKTVALCVLFGAISFLIKNTPGLKERFYEMTISLTKPPENLSYDSTNIRVAIYNCDYEIIKESFWLGVGFNNIKDKIEKCLTTKYDSNFYKNHQYLSHNYYLYILISGGIVSLLSFLFYLYKVFKIVLLSNQFIFYSFFINILLISMIEDFFYRIYGLFFFNLIVLTFYKNNKVINETKND